MNSASNSNPGPSGLADEYSWSNTKCIAIAFKNHFPDLVNDLAVQKNIINRYLDFYLGGKLSGVTVADVTFAVISIMPLHEDTEQFIWDSAHYQREGTMFFLTAEDKLKAEIKNIKHITIEQTENVEKKLKEEGITVKNVKTQPETVNKSVNDENVKEQNIPKAEVRKDKSTEENKRSAEEEFTRQDTGQSSKPTDPRNFKASKTSVPDFPSDIKWPKRNPKPKVAEQKLQYGAVENSAFVVSCKKLLEQWETSSKARIVLKYFFGIVALILMRGTTKQYIHLVNTFSSSKFLTVIPFTNFNDFLKYSVPHKKCFKNSYRFFHKRDGNIPIMFAKIVTNSFMMDALIRQTKNRKLNIFKLTVLAHTSDYGFGLSSMVLNLATDYETLKKIVKATYCKETELSWNRLRRFFERYLSISSKEATHHWARVIGNDYFKHLSCRENVVLSVILAVFIENTTKAYDIWNSSWVSTGSNLDELKQVGLKMFIEYERLLRSENEDDVSDLFVPSDFEENSIDDNDDEIDKYSYSSLEDFRMDLQFEDDYDCDPLDDMMF